MKREIFEVSVEEGKRPSWGVRLDGEFAVTVSYDAEDSETPDAYLGRTAGVAPRVLTHVPTGFSLHDRVTVAKAKRVVAHLRALPGVDWTETDAGTMGAALLAADPDARNTIKRLVEGESRTETFAEEEVRKHNDKVEAIVKNPAWRGATVTRYPDRVELVLGRAKATLRLRTVETPAVAVAV